MKTIYKFILISGLFGMMSCGEDFLELAPLSENTAGNFYRNASDFDQATIAIYDAYGTNAFQNALRVLKETRSDNAYFQLDNTSDLGAFDVDAFNMQPDNRYVDIAWGTGYRTIQLANIVVSRIEGVNFTNQSLKEQYLGEALFMRALVYFDLVQLFGDVPLSVREITSPAEAYTYTRQNAATIMAQVKADLQEAASLLPDKGDIVAGRATRAAALTLLGKVHLALDEFTEAEQVLGQVSGYSLLPDYGAVFSADNENNEESIFELQYIDNLDGSNFSAELTPYAKAGEIFGAGSDGGGTVLPTEALLNSYEEGDERRAKGYRTMTFNDGQTLTWIAKSTNLPPINFVSGDNFIVLRYADVLLMRAEALSQRGTVNNAQALELVNQVRRRAFGLDINTPAPAADLDQLNNEALLVERQRELAIEGHRWFDLLRFDAAVEVMATQGYTLNQNKLLFPIPESQINIYNLQPNPGY